MKSEKIQISYDDQILIVGYSSNTVRIVDGNLSYILRITKETSKEMLSSCVT